MLTPCSSTTRPRPSTNQRPAALNGGTAPSAPLAWVGVDVTDGVFVGGTVMVAVGADAVGVGVGIGQKLTTTPPSLQVVASALPSGSLAPASEQGNGYTAGGAPARIATRHEYRTAPTSIGSTLSSARTMARTAVQSVPGVQKGGWKTKLVPPLSIVGLTVQSGLPF